MSTTETALTVHLVVCDDMLDNVLLAGVQRELHDRFGVDHATIQVEALTDNSRCKLKNNC